ncbi:hypothetical protein J3E71DRAFT_241122 [Bipolaris maydis]|nr:hypothetical protein J3E71DRAFT_241122 [Bipolaris maydis]
MSKSNSSALKYGKEVVLYKEHAAKLHRHLKPNISSYAKAHNLAYKRLLRAYNNAPTRSDKKPTNCRLNDTQDLALERYLDAINAIGFGIHHRMIAQRAYALLQESYIGPDESPPLLDINKADFLETLAEIRRLTFARTTIQSGWRRTGLAPWKPELVLDQLQLRDTDSEYERATPPPTQLRQTTPCIQSPSPPLGSSPSCPLPLQRFTQVRIALQSEQLSARGRRRRARGERDELDWDTTPEPENPRPGDAAWVTPKTVRQIQAQEPFVYAVLREHLPRDVAASVIKHQRGVSTIARIAEGLQRELHHTEAAQLAKASGVTVMRDVTCWQYAINDCDYNTKAQYKLQRVQEDRSVKYNESMLTTDNTGAAEVAAAVRRQVCPYQLVCQLSQHQDDSNDDDITDKEDELLNIHEIDSPCPRIESQQSLSSSEILDKIASYIDSSDYDYDYSSNVFSSGS